MVDSDYQIDPQFLRRCAPLFGDPKVGFIQAPQDYRDWQGAPFYRRLYYSYHYFFAVSQPSRNERDGAIFAGTMGLIRRHALEQAGGWTWCITEDAELSLRILRNGWSGLHVDQSFGKGIMPLTFEGLRRASASAGASGASRSCAGTGVPCCPAVAGVGGDSIIRRTR